jgi:hypothetical protein
MGRNEIAEGSYDLAAELGKSLEKSPKIKVFSRTLSLPRW